MFISILFTDCYFVNYVALFTDDLDNILNNINEKAKKEL